MAKKQLEEMPDDFVERFSKYMMVITPRSKLNTNDVEEMRRRFTNYINATISYGMEFGNINCYKAIGLSAEQVRQFTGVRYNDNPERGDFLRGMNYYLGAFREQAIAKGYMPSIPGIFAQKNWDGMRDINEVQVSHTIDEVRDVKSIASRYQDVIDVEFEHHKQLEAPKQKQKEKVKK